MDSANFAPLTEEEIVAAAAAMSANDSDKSEEFFIHVASAPPDAPKPFDGVGKPDQHWTYRDANGGVAMIIARYNKKDGEKVIFPRTLWRDDNGILHWRSKAYPEPRPIFNLDQLTKSRTATVVVTEGEKSAEAAAKVFPDCIVTTSPGGSSAYNRADWTPLDGRQVIIWPDADTAGEKFGTGVAEKLRKMGCHVSIIEAPELSCIGPDKEPRKKPFDGWDAADAVAEWENMESLRDVVDANTTPWNPEATFRSLGDFYLMCPLSGLSIPKLDKEGDPVKGKDGKPVRIHVCGPFEIVGLASLEGGDEWGTLIRLRDPDGRQHRHVVPARALQGDLASLCGDLAAKGLSITRGQQRALADYLLACRPRERVRIVERTGWVDIDHNTRVFALPNNIIGKAGDLRFELDKHVGNSGIGSSGSLKDWQENVFALAEDHILFVFALCAAFAAFTLHFDPGNSFWLHFWGDTSLGKSRLLRFLASIIGKGDDTTFLRTMRATANGLEGFAASRNDLFLALDEFGQVDGREVSMMSYSITNGLGKLRAGRDGGAREPASWTTVSFSSGEDSFEAKLAEVGKRAKAGQLARVLDIAADLGPYGMFNSTGPFDSSRELADAIGDASAKYYGTAGPAFIKYLIDEKVDGKLVKKFREKFVKEAVGNNGAAGQVGRVASHYGRISAAGTLASMSGVLPITIERVNEVVGLMFQKWLDGRGGAVTDRMEALQAVDLVRAAINEHGRSRFDRVHQGKTCTIDGEVIKEAGDALEMRGVNKSLGFVMGKGADTRWLFHPDGWKEIIGQTRMLSAARELASRKMLEPGKVAADGKSRLQKAVKIDGVTRRFYVITPTIFSGGDDNGD